MHAIEGSGSYGAFPALGGPLIAASKFWHLCRVQDSKGGGEGFEVQKYGDGRVALIGAFCSAWHGI